MKHPEPIIAIELFPATLDALLELLASLATEDWTRPIANSDWSVRDVALHLLGGDVGILSRKRDRYASAAGTINDWNELVIFINQQNDLWVKATRRISSRLLCDLFKFIGPQVCAYFASVDPYALGGPVSWAGPAPAPVWLDLAREYTERWHHQQQIRDAVGKPGLKEPKFLAPVLETFVRALPHTYRHVAATDGTVVALTITGESGGRWFLLKENGAWNLYQDVNQAPNAAVMIEQEIAWRLFTKGLSANEACRTATISGDKLLGLRVLEMVSIIA